MPRQHRTQRRTGTSVRLTMRDVALLRALARFRIARSRDLGRVFFSGRHRDVVASRLRRLYDGRYLEVHVLDLAAENVYALGPQGHAWVAGQGVAARGIPRQPWHHHLGIVDIWTRVAAAVHGVEGLRLKRFVPDWEIREQGLAAGYEVVPDGLLELASTGDTARLVLELDRGTESLEVVRRKVRAFADLRGRRSSFLDWPTFELVLVLDAAGASREAKLRELVANEWPGSVLVWTPQTELIGELQLLAGLTAPALTDSRCGNGRERLLTRDVTERLPATGGRPSEDA